MAGLDITTTYVGKDSKEFISPVLMAGPTLGTPTITIKQNVNYKSRLTKLDVANLVADATCDFTTQGDVNISEKWLQVEKFQVNLELCKSEFINDFIGESMGPGDMPPADFLRYLLGEIGGSIAAALESQVWKGAGTANTFLGFEPKWRLDGEVNDVASPIAADSTTAIAEARRTYKSVSSDIYTASDAQLYVSSAYYQAIKEAHNDKGNAAPCGENCIAVDGIKIVHAPGMNVNSMAIAKKSNLFFGTWSTAKDAEIKVLDMSDKDGSDNFRFVMRYFAGVEYGYGAEIGYYDGDAVV